MTISPTLMQAILAMDSYNRGYNEGLTGLGGVGSQVGLATITQQSDILNGSDGVEAGFYAVAYSYYGDTVISYRGTDDTSDILNGWTAAGGYSEASQVGLAIEFYEAVTGKVIGSEDAAAENTILTGHSLGGGLAGLVASIYDENAVVFDNMPFENAANKVYEWALPTEAQIITLADAAANAGLVFNQAIYDSTYNDLMEKRTYARDTFYNGQAPPTIDDNGINGFFVTGEFLQAARLLAGESTPLTGLDRYGDFLSRNG